MKCVKKNLLKMIYDISSASAMNPKPRGRTWNVRTPIAVERVREAVIESTGRSVRKRAAALRMSSRTVFRILHQDLHFHPYKLMIVQQLNEGDFAQRQQFAVRMQAIFYFYLTVKKWNSWKKSFSEDYFFFHEFHFFSVKWWKYGFYFKYD